MAISNDTGKWDYGSTGKPGVLGLSTVNPGVLGLSTSEQRVWRRSLISRGDGDALGASMKPSWMESTPLVGGETHVVGRKCCRLPRQTALT